MNHSDPIGCFTASSHQAQSTGFGQRGKITYGALVELSGVRLLPRALGPYLTALGERCETAGEPRLDALVVNRRTGRPGSGWLGKDCDAEAEACYRHTPYSS